MKLTVPTFAEMRDRSRSELAREEFYSEDQERDEHGRFTSGMDTAGPIDALAKYGGFTINRDGSDVTTGISVAKLGMPSGIMDANKFFADKERAREFLRSYVRDNRRTLAEQGTKIGGWHDKANGKIVLDHVEVFGKEHLAEAIQAGIDRNQVAVYDIDHGEEIPTHGTGGYAQAASGFPWEEFYSEDQPRTPDGRFGEGSGSEVDRMATGARTPLEPVLNANDRPKFADGGATGGERKKLMEDITTGQKVAWVKSGNTGRFYMAKAYPYTHGPDYTGEQQYYYRKDQPYTREDRQQQLTDRHETIAQEKANAALAENTQKASDALMAGRRDEAEALLQRTDQIEREVKEQELQRLREQTAEIERRYAKK